MSVFGVNILKCSIYRATMQCMILIPLRQLINSSWGSPIYLPLCNSRSSTKITVLIPSYFIFSRYLSRCHNTITKGIQHLVLSKKLRSEQKHHAELSLQHAIIDLAQVNTVLANASSFIQKAVTDTVEVRSNQQSRFIRIYFSDFYKTNYPYQRYWQGWQCWL